MAIRSTRGFGGGGYGGGGGGFSLSFPPFTRMVLWLISINTGLFLLKVLTEFVRPDLWKQMELWVALFPVMVVHGYVYQVVTYAFLHVGFGHWFWNMLALWMFGSAIETTWGSRRFLELYFVGVIGAALFSVAVAYSGVLGKPGQGTEGASGGIYAILIAFGMVLGDNEIFLFPFPFRIKAKYFVAILIVLTVVFSLQEAGGTNNIAHLGGLVFGYLYVKFSGPRGIGFSASESAFGLRNRYYKWKRRRAARKFEVYMRKQNKPTNLSEYFDEYGNYKDPTMRPRDDKKDRGSSSDSGWVN
jgi:membrane associated rhomboid family serine protease